MIVRNFHHRSCDWVIAKFGEMIVFTFFEYERLLEAGSRPWLRPNDWQHPANSRSLSFDVIQTMPCEQKTQLVLSSTNKRFNNMASEYSDFERDLDAAFFNYAHISGAVEMYMQVLESSALQRAFSKTISGKEIEWKSIHRYMTLDSQDVEWYPTLSVPEVVKQKNDLIGFLYGIFLGRMIASVDHYFSSVLKNRFGHMEKSGSCWNQFAQKAKVDLLACRNGVIVFSLLQERNKIEHNKAQIDQKFVYQMMKKGITHSYAVGDFIQRSHLDVLAAQAAIREFVADVNKLVT